MANEAGLFGEISSLHCELVPPRRSICLLHLLGPGRGALLFHVFAEQLDLIP